MDLVYQLSRYHVALLGRPIFRPLGDVLDFLPFQTAQVLAAPPRVTVSALLWPGHDIQPDPDDSQQNVVILLVGPVPFMARLQGRIWGPEAMRR